MKSSTPETTRRGLMALGGGVAAAAALPRDLYAQTPRRGGTLRVSNGGDPPDFDVLQTATYLTQFVGAPCYSTLMRVDPADYNKLIPDLAERWEVSADGKAWTFHLRGGVLFHNGATLTADDVVYSLERIRNPPRGIVSPRKGLLGNVSGIVARDPRTVVVTLQNPQADFPFLVSNPFNVIYCKAVAEPLDARGEGMKRQIVGTGAFRLARAVDGQIYELVRFDQHYGGPAYLDRIQFFPIRGEVERGAALQSRRLDAGFFFPNESVLSTLTRVPNMQALRRPTPTFINMIPNVQREPFNDIRVREALSLAVDRDAFIRTVGPLSGAFYHSLGLMPPDSPYSLTAEEVKRVAGYDTTPGLGGDIAANRRRAIELLRAAGVPEGFKLVIPTRADVPAFRDGAINVAAQLRNVGIDATVDVRDAGAFYTIETTGQFQVVLHSVAVGGSLPDQILGEGYTSFGGRNYGNWADPPLDEAFRKQSAEPDPALRTALIKDFQRAFMAKHYQINLAWVGYGAAHWNTVQGWKALPDLYANMQLDKVWLSA
jgi:peptide/nickel transport system substrate-binding protein